MSEWKETTFGIIPGDWDVKSFRDVLKIKGRIGWKGYKTSDLRESGPVVIGGVNIKSTINLDYSKLTHLSIEKYEESPEIILRKGDVILVTRGNGIGDVGRYDGKFQEATINPSVVILTDYKGDSKFLYYFLASKQGREQILSLEGGSSIPALYQGLLKNLNLPFPKIEIQKSIASFLSSIDNKIDLLHHQNATLEAMAETLFRQWFVEEAKEDWEEGTLSKIIDVVIDNRGKTPPTVDYKTEYPLIEVNALNSNSCLIDYSVIRKYVSKEIFGSWFRKHLNLNDVIISTVGTIGIFSIHLSAQGCIAQNLVGLRSKNISGYFIYNFLKVNKENILNLDIGGVQPSIKVPHLLDLKMKLPSVGLINKYHTTVDEYYKKIAINSKQIRTLTALRDTLLPKLMSGEVRVEM